MTTCVEFAQMKKTEFKRKLKSKCSAEDGGGDRTFIQDGDLTHSRIFLGRRFRSDVLMFRVTWPADNKLVALDDQDRMRLARKASISFARSLIRSFTEGGIEGVSLQSSDIGADVRMFSEEEKKGWDIFVYETADGGIGLLNAIHDVIKKSLDEDVPTKELPGLKKCIQILEGAFCSVEVLDTERNPHTIMQRPCESICHGCLLDFTTQYMMSDLDRELGTI